MKARVHPAAWIGLGINFFCMIGVIYAIDEEFGRLFSSVVVFAAVFIAGFVLSLIGVLMLASGNPTGGIVGMIGSIVYVPIGMICAIGCSISRKNIMFASFGATGNAPDSPPPASAPSGGRSFSANSRTVAQAEPSPARTGFPSASSAPLAAFPFVDQRWLAGLLIAVGVAGFFIVAIHLGGRGETLITPIIVGVILFTMQQRLRGYSVFALYADSLECMPNLWASPVRVPYAVIAEVVLHKRKAVIIAREPGGGDKKIGVAFGNIPSEMREDARRILAQKMRELGVLTERI